MRRQEKSTSGQWTGKGVGVEAEMDWLMKEVSTEFKSRGHLVEKEATTSSSPTARDRSSPSGMFWRNSMGKIVPEDPATEESQSNGRVGKWWLECEDVI